MMKQTFVAALLGCLLAMPSLAQAALTIGIDFEGDSAGSAPAVGPAGNPMTMPTAIGGYTATTEDNPPIAAEGTIVVGSAPGIAKGAIMTTNPSNPITGSLWLDNGFSMVGQKISASFDINVLAAPTTATVQQKILGGGNAGILFGLNSFNSVDAGFRFAAAPTSANGGVFAFRSPDNSTLIPFFNYVEGTKYAVSILADYSTGKLNASIDGNQLLTDYAFWNGGQPNVVTQELFFYLNGESGSANSVALDNINAAAVPEPTTFVVWGIVGLCISAVAWRSTKMSAAA